MGMSGPSKRARHEPAQTDSAEGDDSDAEGDDPDAERFEPCVECEMVPEADWEAGTFVWCDDALGMVCRGCGSFCDRCWQTRRSNEVTWFDEPAADGAHSICVHCWDVCGGALTRHHRRIRRRSGGVPLARAMRRSVIFETATSKLHAPDATFGRKAAAEFEAELGC